MEEPLAYVCDFWRGLLWMELGLQRHRLVTLFFLALGQIVFDQATYFPFLAVFLCFEICNCRGWALFFKKINESQKCCICQIFYQEKSEILMDFLTAQDHNRIHLFWIIWASGWKRSLSILVYISQSASCLLLYLSCPCLLYLCCSFQEWLCCSSWDSI
jgi:hypothetical protein